MTPPRPTARNQSSSPLAHPRGALVALVTAGAVASDLDVVADHVAVAAGADAGRLHRHLEILAGRDQLAKKVLRRVVQHVVEELAGGRAGGGGKRRRREPRHGVGTALGHPRSASRTATNARSIPARSTSRWVTARTRVGPNRLISTPSAASRSTSAAASATSNSTMFVSTSSGATATPAIAASPSASARALAWSSASRSTWWSSAYRPAAATIPAWRSAPPSICL